MNYVCKKFYSCVYRRWAIKLTKWKRKWDKFAAKEEDGSDSSPILQIYSIS
jgi:hypothetical protein